MRKSYLTSLGLGSLLMLAACQKEALTDNLQPISTRSAAIVSTVTIRPALLTSSPLISRVFTYMPAAGQFINETSLGTTAAAQGLVGSTANMVSLGGFGGYIVFGFDHSVVNGTGNDLGIYGNPLGPTYQWSEPGVVMVSQDTNGNGLPDDAWYELAGSQYSAASTIKNYRITYYNPHAAGTSVLWKDNQGASGYVVANSYHTANNYYPAMAPSQDSITFTGTKLVNTLQTGSIVTNLAFAWGYSDSYSSEYPTLGYNTFDIAWAVNASGTPVTLNAIDFVKVYTGQNCSGGTMMGEISTEVKGARDLHL
ncbi:PKD domain-containing protein [Chitinophaga polysaccharea]|uniref:PKD domain-containing protein n=1 Tax=Chitinophaga TaxID=79328 RepID=UPI0014554B08|nr:MULTISPECIES: PKD domain-containing protein [Chitinophaga]NLR57541.1 PKD domain-containing protein [Chitinophaga polysaccharea]NLU95455.1 PKD domain-containing protein [Chitinophaga sp. Ak27]